MSNYEPFNDFWGDFITGIAVTIIATQISDTQISDKSDKQDPEFEGIEEIQKDTRRLDIASAVDDIIIFSSLHAVNVYLFITWWKYESTPAKIFGVLILYSITLLVFEVISRFNMKFRHFIHERRRLRTSILLVTAILFLFTPNSISLSIFDEFCENTYSYENCRLDRILRWIAGGFLIIAWILSPNFKRFCKLWQCGDVVSVDVNKYYLFFSLFFFSSAITIQAVGNGYLLSNNFWQTKVTTGLTIVSITRLLNIYIKSGTSMYAFKVQLPEKKPGF